MISKCWKTTLATALSLALVAILSNCSANKQYVENVETQTVAVGIGNASGSAGTQAGNPAPDFQLMKIDGAPVSLADLRGHPAVIVFWSAWCSVCREEAPRINALTAEYGGKGVRVLGINVKDSLAGAESGVREFGIKYPVARDPDAGVARAYGVRGTPTVIFLDRKGVVRYFGNELPDDYAQRLDELLAEKI
ncbi:MAG TPA: TlpA disulfide reductase family protein [Blastocatellia bacterium]|jgi:peroxiredoxin|nr:TlpA disulfide reductase family protein [Blastocatellia bacterium]